jgi:hypothetical protein
VVLRVIVLLGSVAFQAVNPFREIPAPKPKHIAGFVPADVAGWHSQDVALGPTEFIQDKVEQILNFDDVLNREYRRGGVTFGVYVAYWGAGKMPTRLVASHTPDRCWTENGWTCLDMRFKERRSALGTKLQPADWREFRDPNGAHVQVLFWHLIEGRAYDYGNHFNAIPRPLEWWKDAVSQAVHGSREQYFIRVTSNVSFDDIWEDPGFQTVMAGLARLGLAE